MAAAAEAVGRSRWGGPYWGPAACRKRLACLSNTLRSAGTPYLPRQLRASGGHWGPWCAASGRRRGRGVAALGSGQSAKQGPGMGAGAWGRSGLGARPAASVLHAKGSGPSWLWACLASAVSPRQSVHDAGWALEADPTPESVATPAQWR